MIRRRQPHVRRSLLDVPPRFWSELVTRFGAAGVRSRRGPMARPSTNSSRWPRPA